MRIVFFSLLSLAFLFCGKLNAAQTHSVSLHTPDSFVSLSIAKQTAVFKPAQTMAKTYNPINPPRHHRIAEVNLPEKFQKTEVSFLVINNTPMVWYEEKQTTYDPI